MPAKEIAMHTTFHIETSGDGLYEFTPDILQWTAGQGSGLLTLFVRHTSCSLLIQENADPTAKADLETFFRRLIPTGDDASMRWLTHVLEGPDDMPAHLRAAILPVSLSVPVVGGRPQLGTWQGIYLFEHRARPHCREVAAWFQ